MIDMITNSEVEKIVILYKDRLLRFGFEIIFKLLEFLVGDFKVKEQIKQKMIEELLDNDSREES